ncbi:MAG: hypothetical protein GF330_09540 [Candidatus Eisenbacteria bacterium]|nr:hypothetical protein [Candidatus Eisenbacteria bacterium]
MLVRLAIVWLMLAHLAAAAAAGEPRLVATTGLEVEGLEQVLGDASLYVGDAPTQGTPGEALERLRLRERDTDLLGVLALDYYADRLQWTPRLSGELKLGRRRRVVRADGRTVLLGDAQEGLAIENLFFWDEQRDEARSTGQNLAYLRWEKPLAEDATLSLRGGFDLSWASGDSLASLFDYRRGTLRCALRHGTEARYRWAIEYARKWVAAESRGAYGALVVEAERSIFSLSGSSDVDGRLERRVYGADGAGDSDGEEASGGLRAYWDGELGGRAVRPIAGWEVEARLRLGGTLYDDEGEAELGSVYEDRLRAELVLLMRRPLWGDAGERVLLAGASPAGLLASLEVAAGPTAELLRVRGGDGDYGSAGGRLQICTQGGAALGGAWLDVDLEIGRRDYHADGEALTLDVDGTSFSLAQSDYTYYEISAIGGGRLPLQLEWEVYGSWDQELHTDPNDNGKLLSLRIALQRRWDLLGAS